VTVAWVTARNGIRQHLLWAALAVSIALNLFFVAGALWIRFHEPTIGFRSEERLRQIGEQLELDPRQKQAYDQYVQAIQTRMHLMRDAVEPIMGNVWAELAKPDGDERNVMQLLDEAARVRYDSRRELTSKTLLFLGTLSPEQRAKFVSLARKRPWPWHKGHPPESP
jgi:uncharacterized membrane protein